MKLTIDGEAERCLKRTEEIKNIINYTVMTNETLIDNIPYCGSLINKKNSEYDNDKGDSKHIMECFNNKNELSTSVLIFGPPGIGKTCLAKAVGVECKIPIISVNAWEYQSKYLQFTEKCVESLFRFVCQHQPCMLFVDDIDGLLGRRDDSRVEVNQRIMREFLIQMDGIRMNNARVFLIAAAGVPWLLDTTLQQKCDTDIPNLKLEGRHKIGSTCSSGDPNAKPITVNEIEPDELYVPSLTMSHVLIALLRIKPSINGIDMVKYKALTEKFGEDS
ncbi:unnamed protein product [Rotaria socialis]|uniref:AAA+ ATPase domain-containing protein n=1 Tax=Rotaria socialis TaxID=392032 RepID=A0A818A3T3_9BILA|nr:unnamed protein product [Rotaria socialis]CAF3432917.1 unnamed protein product [Rotaria socialis]CAF4222471.1 unnamed protein product [Rotaria socialis]CAF4318465.1 unnamed protein product [Rotaria socialis]